MNKISQIFKIKICLLLPLLLVACSGGGGGGGSSTPPPSAQNFTVLTPPQGVSVYNTSSTAGKIISLQMPAESSVIYTTFGANGSTLYAGTSNGEILQMNQAFTAWSVVAQVPESLPIIAIAANNSGGVYYVPFPSTTAFATIGSGFANGLDAGNIIALTSSNNGSTYYGTESGNVGLTNNPANKVIPTLPNPQFGPVIAIGCSSSSCNSGQQGVLALQAKYILAPPFESSVFESNSALYTYPTQMYFLVSHDTWIKTVYNGTISNSRTVIVESTVFNNVPEFITTVTVSSKTNLAFAGTNFFNIYVAPIQCNKGQACTITWSSSPINTFPLSTVTNGTQGITNITILPNGKLFIVGNYSESFVGIYQSNNSYE